MRRTLLFILVMTLIWGAGAALAQEDEGGVTHGPISGEVRADAAVLWARGGAAGTLVFEIATEADFSGDLISAKTDVDAFSDYTGEVIIDGLSPATTYFYRVRLDESPARSGSFTTAPDDASGFSFVFGACLGGQGYCRPPETGWEIFNTMAAQEPDFFLLTGDGIYADNGCPSDAAQNVAGAEEIARDLDAYYNRYRYHLEDEHYAAFLAQTPVYVTWDDHEVYDNFGGPELSKWNPRLYEEGRKAFFDYWTIHGTPEDPYQLYRTVNYGALADFFMLDTRSYRDPLVNWDPSPVNGVHKTMLGAEQYAWLLESLKGSAATWKFIVSSVPLTYPTGFPQPQVEGRDGWANGGDRSGYETELMRLLYFIEANDIRNVVFITGDTHFPYAVSFDPDLDGTPNFYEISASPLSAIPLAPGTPDQTFNPTVLYAEGEFMGSLFVFGSVEINDEGEMTYRVINREGETRYELTLSPE